MSKDKYEIENSVGSKCFEFTSEGVNGSVLKVVQYSLIDAAEELYNLGFGDKNIQTGELEDLVITNNGDAEKVLTTVANTIYEFYEEYPLASVYITGSTKSRTRLYQINISKYLHLISADFEIFGELDCEFERFTPNNRYSGFLILKK